MSLLGVPWPDAMLSPPVKAKQAAKAVSVVNLLTDVVDFGLRLRERNLPFVMILPNVGHAFLSNFLAFSGVEGFRSQRWQVIHSVPEEEVPEFLFHRI